MNYVFFSSSAFGLPALEALREQYGTPAIIVTKRDAAAGQNRTPKENVVRTWGKVHRAVVLQPKDITDTKFLSILRKTRSDVFLIASYGKLLPAALLEMPRRGTLNIHPSLLPCLRGPSPIQTTILSGKTLTGVSIMLTDQQTDHGPILAQKNYTITDPHITTPQLEQALAKLGAETLLEILPDWLDGSCAAKEQDHDKATRTKLITKKDGHIDWHESALMLERKIRAYQPWPSAYTFWKKGSGKQMQLQLLRASVIRASTDTKLVGTVYAHKHIAECADTADDAFAVTTGNGALCVSSLKPEGKKEMSSAAFLAGHPDIIGAILS